MKKEERDEIMPGGADDTGELMPSTEGCDLQLGEGCVVACSCI